MNSTVRPITAADLPWVIKADQDFPHPWVPDSWYHLAPHQHCFVLESAQELVGYTLFQYLEGDQSAHLLKIYLSPAYRGQELASFLFNEALQKIGLKEVFLEVGESNLAALKFYEKMGFNKIHLVKGFYSDGENAWLMTLIR